MVIVPAREILVMGSITSTEEFRDGEVPRSSRSLLVLSPSPITSEQDLYASQVDSDQDKQTYCMVKMVQGSQRMS